MNKHSTYPLETILEDIWLAEHPVGDPAGPDGMPMNDHIFVQAMRPRHLDTFTAYCSTGPRPGPYATNTANPLQLAANSRNFHDVVKQPCPGGWLVGLQSRVGWLLGWSVGRSVGWLVGRSVLAGAAINLLCDMLALTQSPHTMHTPAFEIEGCACADDCVHICSRSQHVSLSPFL